MLRLGLGLSLGSALIGAALPPVLGVGAAAAQPATALGAGYVKLASLFVPGSLVLGMQSDYGLTYDTAVTLATGGTSTSTVTLGGTLTNATVPILVKATNSASVGSGATFSVSYDGGATFAMTGITPTAGVAVALTGAGIGSGRTLTWSAGTGVTNDTWEAYAASWADAASSPHNATATTTKRPKITIGTGGRLGLLGNGTSTAFATTLTLPKASVTPTHIYVVGRATANPASGKAICGVPGGASIFMGVGAGPVLTQFDGTAFANNSTILTNTWYAMQAGFTGSASDYTKAGSAAAVAGSGAGDATPIANFCLFSTNTAFYSSFEMLAIFVANQPIATCAPSLAAAITAWCGVTQV